MDKIDDETRLKIMQGFAMRMQTARAEARQEERERNDQLIALWEKRCDRYAKANRKLISQLVDSQGDVAKYRVAIASLEGQVVEERAMRDRAVCAARLSLDKLRVMETIQEMVTRKKRKLQ